MNFNRKKIFNQSASLFSLYLFLTSFQVALDEAAFLLDLASVEGTWDESVERIAECYKEAGLNDIARFILYRD